MTLKIVLTGGPSSGKTSLTKELKNFLSVEAHVCQEAAEMLFRGGFPRQDWPEGLKNRQYAIFHLQKALENIALDTCHDAKYLFFDRGLLDGLCYWPEEASSFMDIMQIHPQHVYKRYDLVIQLGVAHQEDYQNSPVRTEDIQTSLAMEQKLKSIWSPHPNYIFIPYHPDWDVKRQKTLDLIRNLSSGHQNP
ncbi:MAG: ATP-binding protein [Bdellovibrionaceae bacterium]|nr:ATP-binding protein [Pseudobdellovibrionaceae bacterium]